VAVQELEVPPEPDEPLVRAVEQVEKRREECGSIEALLVEDRQITLAGDAEK
jgi:hypothetical protein